MKESKNLLSGYTTMLILRLLEDKDMYGYQMIDELSRRSDDTFSLKAGTLYPLLHLLENDGMISSYEKNVDTSRIRKYYSITKNGKMMLTEKSQEWKISSSKINQILEGGTKFATI